MKFLHYLKRNLSKPGGGTRFLQFQEQQRYVHPPNASKLLENKRNPLQFGNCYIFSRRIGVPHATPPRHRHPILGSFVQRSYFSSNNNNKRMGLLSWYLYMLDSRPILTKCISASVIYAAADLTSQMITMSPSGSVDFTRTARMAAFGLLLLGGMQHKWFNFVAKVLPKRDNVTTLKKIAMGQLLFGPVNASAFFSFNAALQGENIGEIIARLKRDLLPTLLSGLIFWPLCDFLTYKVIPVHLQPLVNSSFAYLWTIYLTYMAIWTRHRLIRFGKLCCSPPCCSDEIQGTSV